MKTFEFQDRIEINVYAGGVISLGICTNCYFTVHRKITIHDILSDWSARTMVRREAVTNTRQRMEGARTVINGDDAGWGGGKG